MKLCSKMQTGAESQKRKHKTEHGVFILPVSAYLFEYQREEFITLNKKF
jgi:hypothetical protein